MIDFLQDSYEWLLALHIISVISWMAGMFYLPRLFVYHCQVEKGSETSELFKVMERKLMRVIINPAMVASWIFGLGLAFGMDRWSEPWFHLKFVLVLLMSGFHGFLARWRKQFERDENSHTEGFYRKMNEVPTVLMILIVFLVIMRPF
ncbi:protoporphyrinogen oxidase HemJ [Emcibacter nanhaiensis]|uniref:Protoporphyrinogen IX oxidase n=1 Tax=Emcibacter nanhaiensis TaxID=1505037 RepID=A0A501PNT0_9PROT|nr:protoporphyrinogen oxidase HemJ [Emcibacter nanhaiensis]TPD61421.1 protoporphyrinogen oxidase HemJ [Emcibacter nanhaiensis]